MIITHMDYNNVLRFLIDKSFKNYKIQGDLPLFLFKNGLKINQEYFPYTCALLMIKENKDESELYVVYRPNRQVHSTQELIPIKTFLIRDLNRIEIIKKILANPKKKKIIDNTLVKNWKRAIEYKASEMQLDRETLEWFIKNFSFDEIEMKNAAKNNKLDEFVFSHLEEKTIEDIRVIEDALLRKKLDIVNCVFSKGTEYSLNIPPALQDLIIQEADCFENSSIIGDMMGGEIIYGIMENMFNIPTLHMWNYLSSNYYDFTSEIQKGMLGKRYFVLKRFKPEEYSRILESARGIKEKMFFHYTLMGEIENQE